VFYDNPVSAGSCVVAAQAEANASAGQDADN
jgi:hypothetical protein